MVKLHEFRRVIGIAQVLYMLGRCLRRRGVRYTGLAIIISGSAILVDLAGNSIIGYDPPWKSVNMAAIPGVVALSTFGLGSTLVCVSNLFSSERVLVADANSMNLMEDRKKADVNWHLEVLWGRVFKYEVRLKNARIDAQQRRQISQNREKLRDLILSLDQQCREHFGINDDDIDEFVDYLACFRPQSGTVDPSQQGFVTLAGWALAQSFPQKYELELTGCDFSLVEDWYDGAFFSSNDCRLQEQFAANKTIRSIRRSVGIPWSTKTLEALFGHPPPVWHNLTMKKIGTCVGTLISKMNKKYVGPDSVDFFDAQDFLWADESNDAMILRTFGQRGEEVLGDLQQCRRELFRRVFSYDKSTAHQHVYRMFGRDLWNAMSLRLDYDIEFAAGLLDNHPLEDIDEMSTLLACPAYPQPTARSKAARAGQMLQTIDAFVTANMPWVLNAPAALRSVRIGCFVNFGDVWKRMVDDPPAAVSIFEEEIIPSERMYSKRICLLRQHYELARLQLLSYVRMVDELAEFS